ncbi:Hypothetical protein GbCGDNIH2_1914 [Granulibacter bethesdensis]|uniref:Leucine-binding protein domain-containing protein n=1 Tax=Granulibacter bethesdensis TaxID=364410 RepID=A0AAN0RF49_9PROT|nr:Hypothetical protein GbCGDNIH3_1914 [Granulibacter bethesdensis]AHJ68237.1 Hypothetical protein GbCGDNIH2_1914 [Granulibacter bethesdensis]
MWRGMRRKHMSWIKHARNAAPALTILTCLAALPAGEMLTPRAAMAQDAAATPEQTIRIVYLELHETRRWPSTWLDQPPADEGVEGARLALRDNATTGRFLNQNYVLDEQIHPTPEAVIQAFKDRLKAGDRNFVLSVPPDLLLRLASLPEAKDALLIDAKLPDDRLRGADCRHNVLHTMPSRAMLADALMQYLTVKNWHHVMLVSGKTPDDALYAEAIRRSAKKFQIRIVADRPWTFNPATQQADTGHFQINTEVSRLTQDVDYDVLIVADEAGNFGDSLSYRTNTPRPVAGTQGMVPEAWARPFDEYASTQFQSRFLKLAHRWMTSLDYSAWMAVRSFGEAATRTGQSDPAKLAAYIRGDSFALAAYKGPPLNFRPWDGQLRQPVLLADDRSLISISPQPGFLHQFYETDTLGIDRPESTCHMQ